MAADRCRRGAPKARARAKQAASPRPDAGATSCRGCLRVWAAIGDRGYACQSRCTSARGSESNWETFWIGSHEAGAITAHPRAELPKLYDLSLHLQATLRRRTTSKSDAARLSCGSIAGNLPARGAIHPDPQLSRAASDF